MPDFYDSLAPYYHLIYQDWPVSVRRQGEPEQVQARLLAPGPVLGMPADGEPWSNMPAYADDPVGMPPLVTSLQAIFPQGVCDYSLPDTARPAGL